MDVASSWRLEDCLRHCCRQQEAREDCPKDLREVKRQNKCLNFLSRNLKTITLIFKDIQNVGFRLILEPETNLRSKLQDFVDSALSKKYENRLLAIG